ncbi:MAG: YciI family protein [Proteobacteria bacterium]|nr:YciI family protein [Pseudomonadota bacterium]MBU1137924.1 YciI family protein [Pseudomonadota bacterium]MBU1232091.1 YciI family protein [Pseudomonadota bacterium]MBU1418201.1 YciI family protein [Pseudomonadota bacterium]MBU1455281.1 YciI family protein [Pseudomonadota bacterium]
MFVVSLTYERPLEEVDNHLDAHVAWLQEEYGKGSFIASGRKVPRTGGVILSGVKTRDELQLILAKDPFQQAGIAQYDITEFIASMTAKGFEKLKE